MAVDFKDLAKLKWYYQVVITAVICGGLLAGVWYQFLTPIQQDIQTKTAQIDELQKTIAKSLQQQKELAKIKQAKVVQYVKPFSFRRLFRLFGKSEAKAVKIDLGVDLPKLQAGCMYFLAPTYFH